MELKYTIPLDPRTKKNHMKIAGKGRRCPVCRKFESQFVCQGKAHDRYHAEAMCFLRPVPRQPIGDAVHIKYHFFMQTRRRVDVGNLIAAADDLLVDAGIIRDDNCKTVVHHDGTRVFYDKQNPRTEIYIKPYKEETDGERANLYGGQVSGPE